MRNKKIEIVFERVVGRFVDGGPFSLQARDGCLEVNPSLGLR